MLQGGARRAFVAPGYFKSAVVDLDSSAAAELNTKSHSAKAASGTPQSNRPIRAPYLAFGEYG
jgi:hypothetical protein